MSNIRVEQWKRKLLDLSLRNPLLNVRDGLKFLPMQPGAVYAATANEPGIVPYAGSEAGSTFAFSSALDEKEVRRRLKELYLTSRSMLNESGVNSLFTVVGCLNWTEKDGGEIRRAPLVLIPSRLVKQTAAPGYRLERTEEDAVVNFCLVELLRTEYGIPVRDVEGGGFGDGDPDFNAVFTAFAEAIATRKGWSITTDTALGIFSFSKVVIWKDLTDHFTDFERHPFVAHLASGTGLYDDKIEVFPQEKVADEIHPEKLFCPMSADSSQLAAVLWSERGKSFVLHGPPGTGKSQTITNIIAHNLALGKRVLFVSEKKAALDVVYKRLAACGLAPFCLELHSNKADKANVMRQFMEALAVGNGRNPANWATTCATVKTSMDELGAVVADLHRPAKNGLTAAACLDLHATKDLMADASLISFEAADLPHEKIVALTESVRNLANEWKGVDREDYAALGCVGLKEWSPDYQTRVSEDLAQILDALAVEAAWKRIPLVLIKALCARIRGTVVYPLTKGFGEVVRERLVAARDHLAGLRLVQAYRLNRRAVVRGKCAKFVAALEDGRIPVEEAARIFEQSCSEKTLNTLISRSRALSGFGGVKQEERIAHFAELDEKYTKDVAKFVVATLSKKLHAIEHPPAAKNAEGKTVTPEVDSETKRELALLKREGEKKKRFLPPRRLLEETRQVALRLKPCFLMSPLSVAQYLPSAPDLFDLVVFDEASQMTVWDSIGVIARGKQLIVVGDPKQLPPTNFFMKGDVKDEDREDDPATEDLESVLDECLASGLKAAHLNWHYRSRHESLIAFSNRHYYEDRLNTFPSPVLNGRLGVSFRCVDNARYDSKTHTNRAEAEAIVDYLFTRLAEPEERQRSWGIVTFSVSQQRLIETLIEQRAGACAWAPEFFDDARPDAFFVKNLENVQGDERDVIMFSVAYAPDSEGRFAMSFGPVNRVGGERRLNVAITRAREQVVLFASVHAADIHAERTNSVGVKHLKALMEFAETGHLDGDAPDGKASEATGIRQAICESLSRNGYAFDLDVGRSAHPIDIAVRDPKDPTRYCLAIECDGARYAGQATVRDRDLLRSAVLKGLGWKVHRAWSVDWAFDPKGAEQRLLNELTCRACQS